MKKKMTRRIEGYWYSETDEKFRGIVNPIPKPNVLTEEEAELLLQMEKQRAVLDDTNKDIETMLKLIEKIVANQEPENE